MKMLPLLILVLLAAPLAAQTHRDGYRLALPGYEYQFPRDHGAHPEFQTEWWYYTGNVTADDGRELGYELTVFRTRLAPADDPRAESPLFPAQIHAAHLAISDITGRRHDSWEALGREALGQARSSSERLDVAVRDWSIEMVDDETEAMRLRAAAGEAALDLLLVPAKPRVIHGENGAHAKGPAHGQASHYTSFTRLDTTGTITWEGTMRDVRGLSWMDHEFGSGWLAGEDAGWDWFALQLDSGDDLMVYDIRRHDGSVSPLSTGTHVGPDGTAAPLPKSDVEITALSMWKSPDSGATYPVSWNIRIPREHAELRVEARFPEQEMITRGSTGTVYWEGAVRISGTWHGEPTNGVGYVELVGYAEPFSRLRAE